MSSFAEAVGALLGRLVHVVRIVKVDAARRFDVEAELRRRIKEAFEREGISFRQRVVYLHTKALS
jgi:hypothetical protein